MPEITPFDIPVSVLLQSDAANHPEHIHPE
jgi:hypothetical protein